MTDLTSLGYPQGFHLGFSFILWNIVNIVIAVLGVKLYLNARKSDLINLKETLQAKSYFFIFVSIQNSLIQVAVFFPDNFLQLYFLGLFLFTFSLVFYFYFWEKNLTSIKRIPTISTEINIFVSFIGFTTSLLFTNSLNFFLDFLILIVISLLIVSFGLYISLIFAFSRHVKGVSTTVNGILIGGVILCLIGFSFENPPFVKMLPLFIVFYVAPILYMVGYSMAFYGINKHLSQLSSYYSQTNKCIVHRGIIEKGTTIHYCPSCGIIYCETCFNQVIKKDGCWNCRQGVDLESEKEWITEHIKEVEKDNKLKT